MAKKNDNFPHRYRGILQSPQIESRVLLIGPRSLCMDCSVLSLSLSPSRLGFADPLLHGEVHLHPSCWKLIVHLHIFQKHLLVPC